MRPSSHIPTQERLKQYIHYDPLTGIVTRIQDKGKVKCGEVFGNINSSGYLVARFDGPIWLVHRLIFIYMTGEVPNEVDHIDGVRDNNRWTNLRSCTRAENMRNIQIGRGISKFKGVSFDKRSLKWRAYTNIGGKHTSLGYFRTEKQAALTYNQVVRELYQDCSKLNDVYI